jgi:hypothetical protein
VVKLVTIMQEIITAGIHKGFGLSAVQLNLSYTTNNTATHKVTTLLGNTGIDNKSDIPGSEM